MTATGAATVTGAATRLRFTGRPGSPRPSRPDRGRSTGKADNPGTGSWGVGAAMAERERASVATTEKIIVKMSVGG